MPKHIKRQLKYAVLGGVINAVWKMALRARLYVRASIERARGNRRMAWRNRAEMKKETKQKLIISVKEAPEKCARPAVSEPHGSEARRNADYRLYANGQRKRS